jgi:superfamily II DNA or RNA helicase/phage repressor protein C with HTH and peptisase S24 domain
VNDIRSLLPSAYHAQISSLDFSAVEKLETGVVYLRQPDNTCLIIDIKICGASHYPYVAYTSTQNELMNAHGRVFRFLFDEKQPPEQFKQEIELFLTSESDPEKIRRFGGNRTEQEPDPTLPESTFEDCFLEAFSDKSSMALRREFSYVDMGGTTRFIDYALFGKNAKFAIELNGESFHHPAVIGPSRYRSQLFKQNSLAADGFRVFRWSLNGMRDRERFILEIKRFMGDARPFIDKSIIRASRPVFTLHEHQHNALEELKQARAQGQNTFLLVLPTGTGKTEIFIEDLVRMKSLSPDLRSLIIVPTRKLREQTLTRLQLRLPHKYQDQVTTDLFADDGAAFWVQTAAYLHRHYYKIPAVRFDTIVVDEAHHAPAQGLSKILEHFTPSYLLGVTATPERFDQQRLEKIFGEYEAQLSLEDAIRQGLVPPVRCYRIKSNIDLSEVRFNGREYVKTDLQSTLLVPSRDQLIVDILNKYFSGEFSKKQGVIFCVDIKHARRMAALLQDNGISAAAVDGNQRKTAEKAQKLYTDGDIRFLCACDLLTEGWDAPQTSILVMARPTFSKVLYTQQLGRGLRNYPDKEALYVLDVVDNYGAKLQPMSLHGLLRIPEYKAFENLIDPEHPGSLQEITVLDGIYEGVSRIEPVDILTFEEMYGTYLNEEQLARELFVSTGSVKTWLRQRKISADVEYPFGWSKIHFFAPARVSGIREQMGLKEHTEQTRADDFMAFLDKRDYTFSYKIIFLLAFLKTKNERFEAHLPAILELYQKFYQGILDEFGKNERPKSPYNKAEYLEDKAGLQRSLLANPFEKFERKRFLYHCVDLDYIALDPVLGNNLTAKQYQKVTRQMVQDLLDYYQKLDIPLTESNYDFLLPESSREQEMDIFETDPPEEEKFASFLPFYPLDIAAGDFMESTVPTEPETWLRVKGKTSRDILAESMFAAKIQGKSMEPLIPDGSIALFTFDVAGTRNGRIVLAQKSNFTDPETGASYTIKKYHSSKVEDPDTGWHHETINLEPLNPDFQSIAIPSEDGEDFRIVAFFVEVLV